MKTDKTYHRLTDKDRDAILKLFMCGLPTEEIADIIHCSRSTVGYLRQAHTACINKDWSTLQKLSVHHRATVDWAMKVTGADKVFLETFPKDEPEQSETVIEHTEQKTPTPEVVTREEFLALYDAVQVMRDTLIDLYNALR